MRERLNCLIANETGQSEERVTADSDGNFRMDATQAQEYSLVARSLRTRSKSIEPMQSSISDRDGTS